MNKQTTYEHIREIRNKMFPPKLKFGCEVLIKSLCRDCENYNGNEYNFCNDFECEKQIITVDHRDKVYIDGYGNISLLGAEKPYYSINMTALKEEIDIIARYKKGMVVKILGRPISLNDILLMMGRKKKGNDIYAIKEDGKLIDVFLGENIYGGIQFDLTLPIKDQDEETLIKILSLIE